MSGTGELDRNRRLFKCSRKSGDVVCVHADADNDRLAVDCAPGKSAAPQRLDEIATGIAIPQTIAVTRLSFTSMSEPTMDMAGERTSSKTAAERAEGDFAVNMSAVDEHRFSDCHRRGRARPNAARLTKPPQILLRWLRSTQKAVHEARVGAGFPARR